MCALSQEGSLGSFSGSDRSFARRIEAAAESVPTPCHHMHSSHLSPAIPGFSQWCSLASSALTTQTLNADGAGECCCRQRSEIGVACLSYCIPTRHSCTEEVFNELGA